MNGDEFCAIVHFMGFNAAMALHDIDVANRFRLERASRPTLSTRWGFWFCRHNDTEAGYGTTPKRAYQDWRNKLESKQ